MKKTTKRVLCGLLCLVLCISCVFAGCRQEIPPAAETAPPERVEHTVTVKNTADEAMAGIGVYVYTDETKAELVWFAKTNDLGTVTFSDVRSDSYVAVLADVPQGYKAEELYPLTGTQTEIVLESGLLSGDALEGITVGLGDMMFDFTITDTDGNTHILSQLLQEKDAVVLNFWFMGCEPCKAEFPYLQQAYEKYSDRIAVLALNPIDSDESAVAAYKADMELTMPVAVVDPQWAQILGLTAYPTTVVIDRFGTVTLMHTGSIPSTEGFAAIFETFVGEDYEQEVVENPQEIIPVVGTKGSLEDPYEFGGVNSFEVTVEPGKTVYVRIYKAFDMYMQIKSADATVVLGEKTYKPQDGKVGLTVNCEDTYTPVMLQIGNTGTETKTFKATLTAKSGTVGNPKAMSLGDFTVKVNAGNEQGVYYAYKAEKDGILTLQCLEGTAGVKYNFALYNLNTYAYRTLDADGEGSALSIKVKKGQNIQFIMFTVPDESFKYPAGTFQMRATLSDGAVGEEEIVQTGIYSVTVRDDAGQPLSGVKLLVKGETYSDVLTTDDTGAASATLPLDSYTATVTVPAGYTAEVTEVNLTAENPSGELILSKVVVTKAIYQVTVLEPDGVTPMENVLVIMGDNLAYTDAAGMAVLELEQGEHKVYLSNFSSDYSTEESYYTFPDGATELTVTLLYTPGTENNPITIDSNPYTTEKISGGNSLWYHAYNVGGMILTIADENAYVIYNGVTYGADSSGNVVVALEPAMPMAPTALIVGNSGTAREDYTLNFSYPKGHRENPIVLADIASFTAILAEGDEDGLFYSWLPEETGMVIFRIADVKSETAGVTGDISVNDGLHVLSADGVTDENGELVLQVHVTAEEKVLIQVLIPADMETWAISAGEVTVAGDYLREETEATDPTEETEPEEPTEPTEETEPEEPTEPTEETEPEEPTEPTEETEPEEPTEPTEETEPEEPTAPTEETEPAEPVAITLQPADSNSVIGEQAVFTVGLSYTEGVSYRWYISEDGGVTWNKSNYVSASTDTLTFTVSEARIGWKVYCEITDPAGNVIHSDVATVTEAVRIVLQPVDSYTAVGGQASFTVVLNATEGVSYQWYLSKDGGNTWSKSTEVSATTATLQFAVSQTQLGWKVYCEVTDAYGKMLSSQVATVKEAIYITQQPVDSNSVVGEQTVFTVGLSSTEGVSYRWYISEDGGVTWNKSNYVSASTATLTFTTSKARIGWKVYCEITDPVGNVIKSDVATVKEAVYITQQPADSNSVIGGQAAFTVGLSGTEGVSYQWYLSKDGGVSWSEATGSTAKTATLSFTATADTIGWQVYCQITDHTGRVLKSNVATVTEAVQITAQPKDAFCTSDERASFTVGLNITEGVSYQWYLSQDGGASWSKCTYSSARSATLSFAFYEERIGWQVYCQITDASGNILTSNVATVRKAIEITQQPADVTPVIGQDIMFTVGLSETEGVTYQWYLSKNSGTSWSKCTYSTATTATLTFRAEESHVGWQFRCEITDASGKVLTTNVATVLEPDNRAEYVITVTDHTGKPVSGVTVAVYSATQTLIGTEVTDAGGQVKLLLERASYTVKLLQTTAYYDQTAAVLTAMDTALTICLAAELDAGDTTDLWISDEGTIYTVPVGETHVKLGNGQVGYSTEYGVTFFLFTPEASGIYRFTTSNPNAVIDYWGGTFYISRSTPADYANNTFTMTVYEDQVGNVTYVLGVEGSGECSLIITRIGDPGYNPDLVPYETYTGTIVPETFTYTGGALINVDYTGKTGDYTLVFNSTDGLYHIGSKNGPVLYANLVSGRFISLYDMVNGQGNIGAQPFRAAFYNAKGEYIKEDYTELMQQYTKCADATTGVYPVNEELMYILKKGIEYKGWADSSNPNYLFKDDEGNLLENVNSDLSWMFLFCYEATQ